MILVSVILRWIIEAMKQRLASRRLIGVSSDFVETSAILSLLQPRSQGLSSSRRETLVWAGHVSMYTNEIPIGGGSLT